MDTIEGTLVFIVLLILIWLFIGLMNYRSFNATIEGFRLNYKKFEKMEAESKEMGTRAQAYLEKSRLIEQYPFLYEQMLRMGKGEKNIGIGYFLLLGPLFWTK